MALKRKKLKGTAVSSGIVLGMARVVMPGDVEVAEVPVPLSRIQAETNALERAVGDSVAELRSLKESAGKKLTGPVAKILEAQLLIASDYEFLEQAKREIRSRRRNAGFVYNRLVQHTVAPLKKSKDTYMRHMAQDIEAVAGRILSNLSGFEKCDLKLPPNTILVGKIFTPGEIVSYRQRKAVGFLVAEGGADSHMALIARSLMLPMLVASRAWTRVPGGCRLILDGITGDVIVNPTDEEWSEYKKRKKRYGPALVTRIRKLTKIPPVTRDGREVGGAANLSLPGPIDDILAQQRIPVGLYRTEFLCLAGNGFPDEETQYQCYDQIAQKFSDTTVVLRTFDMGYDKTIDDGSWPEEDNPALGWRGIRAMLDMTAVFKTQIRAILRASALGNLRIMLPMITELSELERTGKLISQAKLELRRSGVPFDENIKVGIMVEVPAAALTAEVLARKADFISIGTNDLTQYTMAADRTNSRVAALYSSYHPSVLSLIDRTVTACARAGKPVSICGEVAGDILALPLFVGMGVDQLSMSPNRIFDLCRNVKRIDSQLVRHLVGPIVSSRSQQSVKRKLENYRTEMDRKQTHV